VAFGALRAGVPLHANELAEGIILGSQLSGTPGGIGEYSVNAADVLTSRWISFGCLDVWFADVWNLVTAKTYGLDLWGRIVGVIRSIKLQDLNVYFGFSQGRTWSPFNQAPFWNGTDALPGFGHVVTFDNPTFLKVILAKAFANITDCCAPSLNYILSLLFEGRGIVYVEDLQDRIMTLVFDFEPDATDLAILVQTGVIARPAGIQGYVRTPTQTFPILI
jgi:hypothetical protein